MADPWMKFYPNDWIGEPKLKLVSRAARSLWIDMLCLMHQAGTGRLEKSGRPMTQKELAKILGDNPRTIKKLMAELAEESVSIIVEGSFVASSRMIEDFEKAERDRSNGRKGGNPAIKIRDKPEKRVNPEDKAQKPEARSQKEEDKSSSSQEVEKYQDYLKAHPNPVESDVGAVFFSELIEAGEDPSQIIAAAKAYADTVKGWSEEAKVFQSDNFLDPERCHWRKHIPKPKAAVPDKQTKMNHWAKHVRAGRAFGLERQMAEDCLAAGLFTQEQLTAARGYNG